jgi:hypothetical protein
LRAMASLLRRCPRLYSGFTGCTTKWLIRNPYKILW